MNELTSVRGIWPFGRSNAEEDENLIDVFHRASYVGAATDRETTILVGRRGTGKTALALYLESLVPSKYQIHVEIDKKVALAKVIETLDNAADHAPAISSDLLADLWRFLIWIEVARGLMYRPDVVNSTTRDALRRNLGRLGIPTDGDLLSQINNMFSPVGANPKRRRTTNLLTAIAGVIRSPTFMSMQDAISAYIDQGNDVLIVMDTIDDYRVRDPQIDQALAGLIAAAASLGNGKVSKHLHLKCFLPAELYPYLCKARIINVRKVHPRLQMLRWAPRQLFLMLCRRLASWLEVHSSEKFSGITETIDWNNVELVRERIWGRVFPKFVQNRRRVSEETFKYIARHTHLHPGHMIWVCNRIAQMAAERGSFPSAINQDDVVNGVTAMEVLVAGSIIGPYDAVFPNVEEVLKAAFREAPAVMKVRELLPLTLNAAEVWPRDQFPVNELKLLSIAKEIGIIGKVLPITNSDYCLAQFQFHMDSEIVLRETDQCAIHPAFYEMFETSMTRDPRAICPVVIADEKIEWTL